MTSSTLRSRLERVFRGGVSERLIILVIGAAQFVNVLDFVIVMPLGPDFARELAIGTSQLPLVGSAYTAAAAVAGLAGSFFLDRYDRRTALSVSLAGLVVGTLACAVAQTFPMLLAARLVAGAFGGPATALSYSIIADTIPPERRGKAMGAVMGAFSAASVFGVPLGLQLAVWGGWHLPFFVVAALGAAVTAGAFFALPPMRGHLTADRNQPTYREILTRPTVIASYSLSAVMMMGGFIILPSLPAYILGNLHYPRERFGLLYLIGGTVSFITMRYVGRLVDRFGSFRTGTVGSVFLIAVLYCAFYTHMSWFIPPAIFGALMFAMSFRNVACNTLTSKVPRAPERARFMSLQSCVQHVASATASYTSARLLTELPDGALVGIPRLALIAMALAVGLPFFLKALEDRLAPA
jgi:predicted MFS family arabinose efflux permease